MGPSYLQHSLPPRNSVVYSTTSSQHPIRQVGELLDYNPECLLADSTNILISFKAFSLSASINPISSRLWISSVLFSVMKKPSTIPPHLHRSILHSFFLLLFFSFPTLILSRPKWEISALGVTKSITQLYHPIRLQ